MKYAEIAIAVIMAASSANACQSVKLKFDGTVFAEKPLEIEGRKIFFNRGVDQEISFVYDLSQKKWCYSRKNPVGDWPTESCLTSVERKGKRFVQAGKKIFAHMFVRDRGGKAIASMSVYGPLLTATLLDGKGKTSGKRISFKNMSSKTTDELQIKGWNCPNSRYLSCVGAELKTVPEPVPGGQPVKFADIGKNLAHFEASCDGLREQTEGREPSIENKKGSASGALGYQNFQQ